MASRPSVLWVNHFAVGRDAGGGTRHLEMAKSLRQLGWDVTVVASDFNFQSRRYARRDGAGEIRPLWEEVEGVTFCWLWSSPYKGNDWRRGLNWLTFSASLLAVAPRRQWDLVIGSSPHLFAAWAACRVARTLRVPFVFEVRDLWPESLVAVGGGRGALHLVLSRIADGLYREADGIVVFAEGTERYLRERKQVPPDRLALVPNGVDPSEFPTSSQSPEGPEEVLTFVYAGAHGPANGLEVVLGAAELLRHEPRIRFLLVGDGPMKDELRATASTLHLRNVEFRDPVPKSDIPNLLGSADVGLMVLKDTPLFRYGVSPNKLFDYLASGLPVLCNVPGEVGDMVEHADAGIVVDAGSAESLAEGVRRFSRLSHEARWAMGHRGRSWVVRERSRDAMASRLSAFLGDTLRGR